MPGTSLRTCCIWKRRCTRWVGAWIPAREYRRRRKSCVMPGKPGFRVRAAWPRPEAALLDAFGAASSAQVADCMMRLGGMDRDIRPIWPSPRIIGPAITVWCHSGDNLMLHKALSLAAPGDIVVMNTQGNVGNAVFGELMATSAL